MFSFFFVLVFKSNKPKSMEKKKVFFGTFNNGHVSVINEFGLIGIIRIKRRTKKRLSRPVSTWKKIDNKKSFFFCLFEILFSVIKLFVYNNIELLNDEQNLKQVNNRVRHQLQLIDNIMESQFSCRIKRHRLNSNQIIFL